MDIPTRGSILFSHTHDFSLADIAFLAAHARHSTACFPADLPDDLWLADSDQPSLPSCVCDPGTRGSGRIHSLDSEEGGVEHQILEEVSTVVGCGFPADIGGHSGWQMDT